MKETELNKVLNYMKQYVENKYEHDSEPMLNYKDLQLVLEEMERLKGIIKEVREYIKDHTTHYTSYLGREHKVVPKIELQREAYDKLLEILRGEE